jgi:hypothetical protein
MIESRNCSITGVDSAYIMVYTMYNKNFNLTHTMSMIFSLFLAWAAQVRVSRGSNKLFKPMLIISFLFQKLIYNQFIFFKIVFFFRCFSEQIYLQQ